VDGVRSTRVPTATPTFQDVFVKRDPQFVLGVAAVCVRGLASGFLQSFWFQAVRLPVRIEIPCVALKNTLDVTSAVQDTDNFDRLRQSMIENDVAAKGKTLHPRS